MQVCLKAFDFMEELHTHDSIHIEGDPSQALPRYRRLRRISVIATSLVALIPLFILVMINYYQDQESYHAETRYTIARILSNSKRTLEFVVAERRAALSLIITQHPYRVLGETDRLKTVLKDLNSSFGGFVDLGLIDSLGNQTVYVGPYDLRGKNYKDQAWFNEVMVRGEYVSDVFMGHRNLPHFVIAFRHESIDGDFFILRATIDMEMINRIFYALDLDPGTDAFLINQQGILQTNSMTYGSVLGKINFEAPRGLRQREVIGEYEEQGKWLTTGYTYIESTPFILMVIKQREKPFMHWFYRRTGLLWFLVVSSALIIAVVIYGAGHTIKRLRELDKRRARIFHNIEYTNKMATIGRMAAGVAHEINNPLAIINEKAGLLNDMANRIPDLPQKDKFMGLADSITKSVERCSRVTHRLLGFARRMDSRKETIDLKELLEEVVGFQKTELVHRDIYVSYNIPPDLKPIECDRGQLQQVFLNIINNAFTAVDVGGRIDIAVEESGDDMVKVTFTDNGTGIPEKDLKNIFEPFYSTKGEFGTGLGLSITRDIIQKLEGRIDVQSKVGTGTSFTVSLPRRAKY